MYSNTSLRARPRDGPPHSYKPAFDQATRLLKSLNAAPPTHPLTQ